MNRSFIKMLHFSLSLLGSSAKLRSSPPACGAHATAWFPPTRERAAMLQRFPYSPGLLRALEARADLFRREHPLPCAPSPPPARARWSSLRARPSSPVPPPPAKPGAFDVSYPSSLHHARDSSPPQRATPA